MIISASRRTDIPAFYTPWFINRLRAGYCTVPNPFNRSQVGRVSLLPQDVDVIVFWTRNPRPLLPFLDELDERGYRYYFQYTLMDNPKSIDPHCPPLEEGIATFQALAARLGAPRVIWRYDPIVFSTLTPPDFHLERYARLATALRGCTLRSVISIMDEYPKIMKRLKVLAEQGAKLLHPDPQQDWLRDCIRGLASIASASGMEITSCAEELDLAPLGVLPGKCVDDDYIRRTFGIHVDSQKDPSQRKACGCVTSRDIGMYDSCLFGCQYCYATGSFATARRNHEQHDPASPSLVGWYD